MRATRFYFLEKVIFGRVGVFFDEILNFVRIRVILRTGIGFELLKSYILCLRVISMSKFDGESIPTGFRELTSLHIVDFAHQSHRKGKNGIFKIHRAII